MSIQNQGLKAAKRDHIPTVGMETQMTRSCMQTGCVQLTLQHHANTPESTLDGPKG